MDEQKEWSAPGWREGNTTLTYSTRSEPTCLFVLVDDQLPNPQPLLQCLDDSGQGDVIVGVHQLTAGERGDTVQQLAQGGGKVWGTQQMLSFLPAPPASLSLFVVVLFLMLATRAGTICLSPDLI